MTASPRVTPLTTPRSLGGITGSSLKSPNASAAADLIRNLDKALLSAQASSLTAKDDAERARRNARAAGEVARRYGGGKLGAKKGMKKIGENGGEGERSLLEMKRERRSRARMAAEARQRREYEISGGGVTPWDGGSPRGDQGIPASAVSVKDLEAENGTNAHDRRDEFIGAEPRGIANKSSTDTSHHKNDSSVQPVNHEQNVDSNKENISAEISNELSNVHFASNGTQDEIQFGLGMSNDTMSTTDGTVSTMDFEDALDSHSVENKGNGYYEGVQDISAADATGLAGRKAECRDKQGQNDGGNAAAYNDQSHQEGYYNQNHQDDGQCYYNQYGSQQQSHYNQDGSQSYAAVATPTHDNKTTHASTATPIASNQTLESSNAEDVLTLSLELERVRSQLATTTQHLTTSQSHISTLQSHNSHLQSEINRLHSELESVRERNQSEVQVFESKYNAEVVRANAAEEDATVALELAKDATTAKEECEEWLNRSMEEINVWKGRCGELERDLAKYKSQQSPALEEEEPKKVRFADESPASPTISEDVCHHQLSPNEGFIPLPPPPRPTDASSIGSCSTPQTTPNKSSIASGRAFLYRTSPGPSPYKTQVQDLLKRTAETRRLLKESQATPIKQPPSLALVAMPRAASNGSISALNEDGFASRQGAACRSVGKTIRDSGKRLNLEGKWFGDAKALTDGTAQEPAIEGVAELESMVKEYCGNIENKIGSQNEKIEELLAFCDHLEKELMNVK